MSRIFASFAALALGLGGTAALAQDDAMTGAMTGSVDISLYDTDADGLVSMAELAAMVPSLTEEQFTAADTSGDGALDIDELNAASEAGLLMTDS